MKIPENIDETKEYFLDKTSLALREQIKSYKEEVKKLDQLNENDPIPVDILRIAYNFTDDAIKLVKLLVSLSDLKPIILWGTFISHYNFATALKNLPWSKQMNKPKINNYRDQISKARNRSFHRLLPFSKSFEVVLPNDTLEDVRIRFFSEYSGKESNNFTFKDKPIVDLLMDFSRTSEEVVERDFWKRNSYVMDYTLEMVEKTSEFLKICHKSR